MKSKTIKKRAIINLRLVAYLCFSFSIIGNLNAQGEPEQVSRVDQLEELSTEQVENVEIQDGLMVNEPVQAEENSQSTYDPQLIAQLNTKQQQLSETLDTEDAYSLRLAEVYTEYGGLLLNAKRFDEATNIFQQALHIEKVNNGIYAVEQLYVLKALGDIAIENKDDEQLDAYLSCALLIKNHHGDINNSHLNDMFVAAGKYYINQYYSTRNYKAKIEYLKSARYFYDYVLARQRGLSFEDQAFPFGELLLISYLENTIISGLSTNTNNALGGYRPSQSALEYARSVEARREFRYLGASYNRGMDYLEDYIVKARQEENGSEIVRSLLAAGDTHLLFGDTLAAAHYYKRMWTHIEKYDLQADYLIKLASPETLPSYEYLNYTDDYLAQNQTIEIPLSFNLSSRGVISNIRMPADEEQKRYFNKARQELRRLAFRPMIVDGDLVALKEYVYPVKVRLN